MATAAAAQVTQPTQAARARQMTREQKLARSLAIAARDGLIGQSRYHSWNRDGDEVYSVPSRSQTGRYHIVRHTLIGGDWLCGCAAAEHGLPCGHVGAALHQRREMQEVQRYYEFAEWLETRGW